VLSTTSCVVDGDRKDVTMESAMAARRVYSMEEMLDRGELRVARSRVEM